MNSFRTLLKGQAGGIISVAVFAFIFLLLVVGVGTSNSPEYLLVLLLIYIFFIVLALVTFLIYAIIEYNTYKKAKEKLKAIPGFLESRFERETEKAPKIKRVLLSSDAICFTGSGYMVRTIPIGDIVWAYQEQQQGSMFVQIYTRDKERYQVPVIIKKKFGTGDMACRYILRLIARKNKGALIGYEEEYEKMYKNNFSELLMKTRGGEVVDSALLEQEYVQNNYYVKDFQ